MLCCSDTLDKYAKFGVNEATSSAVEIGNMDLTISAGEDGVAIFVCHGSAGVQ